MMRGNVVNCLALRGGSSWGPFPSRTPRGRASPRCSPGLCAGNDPIGSAEDAPLRDTYSPEAAAEERNEPQPGGKSTPAQQLGPGWREGGKEPAQPLQLRRPRSLRGGLAPRGGG